MTTREFPVDVTVLVYLEPTDSGTLVWCAESPEVPGFYAADDSLNALLVRAEYALSEIFAEERPDSEFVIRWELVGGADSAAPELAGLEEQLDPGRSEGNKVVTSSSKPAFAA